MTNFIPVFRPPIPNAWQREIAAVVESRWWGYGVRCGNLESEFTQIRGGWALATNSCTSALYLAGRCLAGVSRGEVIVPAITFISTAVAFHEAGLRVRVADVDPSTLLLDVQKAAALVTPETRAIVSVHLFGQKQDLRPLRALCDEHGLSLIEDCAHRLDGRAESSLADFSCFSFNAVKEAPAGEGGMLWGRHVSDEGICRANSYLGMNVDTAQRASSAVHKAYDFSSRGGLKLRLSDLSAAFVHACKDELGAWRRARQRLHARYFAAFRELDTKAQLICRDADDDSLLVFALRVPVEHRERLRQTLAARGIATSVHYPSISEHPIFSIANCPIAERAGRELVTLPLFPELSDVDQDRVIAAFGAAVEHIQK